LLQLMGFGCAGGKEEGIGVRSKYEEGVISFQEIMGWRIASFKEVLPEEGRVCLFLGGSMRR